MTSCNKFEGPDPFWELVQMVTAHPLSLRAAQKGEVTLLKTEAVAGFCGVVKMSQKIRRAAPSVPAGCPSHCLQGESRTWLGQPFPCPLLFSHCSCTALFIHILEYNLYLCNNCASALLGVLQELLQLQLSRFLKLTSS